MIYAVAILSVLLGAALALLDSFYRELKHERWRSNHWRTGYAQLVATRASFYAQTIEAVKGHDKRPERWN